MDNHVLIEMIGYTGSLLIVISMLMSSVMKLRIINSIGSCIFAVYAITIHSYPTALMNFCLVSINIYNMSKLLKRNDKHYHLVKGNIEDTYLEYFLNYYMDDIRDYFPEFSIAKDKTDIVYFICCGENPAGVLLGHSVRENAIDVLLEYSTPMYRDCSAGKYLYKKLKDKGIAELIFRGNTKPHEPYLEKMGYVKSGNEFLRKM